jgi:hypothetical protein
MTGAQRRRLHAALLSAFPTWAALAQLVNFHLDLRLAAIAGSQNAGTSAFEVIEWAVAHNRVADLVRGAREENPGNPYLLAVAQELDLAPGAPAAPLPAAAPIDRVVEQAGRWLRRVLQSRGEAREQTTARMVEAAGVIVKGLYILDSELKQIFGELRLSPARLAGLSDKDREALVKRVNTFARQEKILGTIRLRLGTLRAIRTDDIFIDAPPVHRIIAAAEQVQRALSDSGVTPFPSPDTLNEFLDLLSRKDALSPAEQAMLRAECDKILNLYQRSLIAESEAALGELLAQVSRQYPGLPDPAWIRSYSFL